MHKDEYFMEIAISEACKSLEYNDVPVGAIVVMGDEVISAAHNEREKKSNAIYHAEMLAISRACEKLNNWRLNDASIYVTLEPCPMCAGAIVQSRIKRLIFGACDLKMGACGSITDITRDYRYNHWVTVDGPLLEDKCSELLKAFFSELR